MTGRKKKQDEKNTDLPGSKRSLRNIAEEQLARVPKHSADLKEQTPDELIHELQVHQIELEIQAEELRKAHLALEDSRDKYLDLYEFAPLGYFTLTNKALIAEVNLSGAILFGVERSNRVNARFRKFIAPEYFEPWDWYFLNVLNEREERSCTLMLKRVDGSIFPARLESIRTPGKSNGTPMVRVAISDITDIRTAEEALRKSEERLRFLVSSTPVTIYTARPSGDFGATFISENIREVLGYKPEDFTLDPGFWQRNIHPDEVSGVFEGLSHLSDHDHHMHEYRFRHKDGTWRWVHDELRLIRNPDGSPLEIIGYWIDITERKATDETIRTFSENLERQVIKRTSELSDANLKLVTEIAIRLDAEKQLSKSLGEKEILFREVHHRVKNNLQIILSLLNLQSRYITDEKTLAAFRESQNRVKAMALVHEKLYQSADLTTIDLNTYLQFLGNNLLQFFGMKGKGIALTMDIRDVFLAIDTTIPIGLIINELMSNSLKYAFPDGRTGEISLTIHHQDHMFTLLFKDNGVGIPKDLDWRDTKSLGLRLVCSLVDQLDGTIELDRSTGTAFTIVVKEKE